MLTLRLHQFLVCLLFCFANFLYSMDIPETWRLNINDSVDVDLANFRSDADIRVQARKIIAVVSDYYLLQATMSGISDKFPELEEEVRRVNDSYHQIWGGFTQRLLSLGNAFLTNEDDGLQAILARVVGSTQFLEKVKEIDDFHYADALSALSVIDQRNAGLFQDRDVKRYLCEVKAEIDGVPAVFDAPYADPMVLHADDMRGFMTFDMPGDWNQARHDSQSCQLDAVLKSEPLIVAYIQVRVDDCPQEYANVTLPELSLSMSAFVSNRLARIGMENDLLMGLAYEGVELFFLQGQPAITVDYSYRVEASQEGEEIPMFVNLRRSYVFWDDQLVTFSLAVSAVEKADLEIMETQTKLRLDALLESVRFTRMTQVGE